MNVTLWIPAADAPRWPCVISWLEMEVPDGCTMNFVRSGANNVRYSWNKVVSDFLASDSDYLFSCHNDVVLPLGALPRLLSWDKPLVSGLVFMRQSPATPHIWKDYDGEGYQPQRIDDTHKWFLNHPHAIQFKPLTLDPRPDDALVEVGFTSTSCTLIHRSVLEAIFDQHGADWAEWFLWDDDYKGGGEDRRFFELARAAGFPGYVDRSCVCGHLAGDIPMSSADFMGWYSISQFQNTGER